MQYLVDVLWIVFLGLAGWRLEKITSRAFSLAERQISIKESTTTKSVTGTKPEIPSDLYLDTLIESEPWAREQSQKLLLEKLNDLGSWDAVRQVVRQK